MDFFGDDFAFGDTPTLNKRNSNSAKKLNSFDNASKKSNKGGDQIDDLLDDLLNKQQIKKSRRQNVQPYSSQNLAQSPILDSFRKTTDKFNIGGSQTNLNFMSRPPKLNFAQKKLLLNQDLMSQDNKSYKSGATGKGRVQSFGFEGMNNMKNDQKDNLYEPSVSMRNNMRPPLKRKNQSRQPSILNDDRSVSKFNDNFGSINDLDIMSVTPNPPRRSTMNIQDTKSKQQDITNFKVFDLTDSKAKQDKHRKGSQPQIRQKIVQKTVIVKQESKQVKERHDAQLKMLKDSYERQINSMQQKYQKLLKDQKQTHTKHMRESERMMDQQQRKQQKLMKSQTDRIKQLYQWQNKKKCEAYQMQIERMKKLLQLSTSKQNTNRGETSIQQQKYELMMKKKQFQRQRKLLQQKSIAIQQKRRQLQSEQHQFQLRKRVQQERLNTQKKKLFEYESQLRKRQMQQKRQFLTQKQNMASQMANTQLLSHQAKQNLREDRQKLNLQRRLFEQQKMEYQNFNQKIIDQYRSKQRDLQQEKQKLQTLEIELYRKVNTVQMMAMEKGIPKNSLNNTQRRTQLGRTQSVYQAQSKQNDRNRSNSELDNRIRQTQNRYADIQSKLKANDSVNQRYSSKGSRANQNSLLGPKIHLQKYIQKLTKQKMKL